MENLVGKILNVFCLIVSFAGLLWPFHDIEIKTRIIIILCSILFALIYHIHVLYKRNERLKLEFTKITKNRKALSIQFSEKQQTIREYENAVISVRNLLSMAILTKKEQKFDALAESIMFHFNNINKE